MGLALGHAEIGAVESAGMDLDQHLCALRLRLGNVGDGSAAGAVDIGFHGIIPLVLDPHGEERRRRVSNYEARLWPHPSRRLLRKLLRMRRGSRAAELFRGLALAA